MDSERLFITMFTRSRGGSGVYKSVDGNKNMFPSDLARNKKHSFPVSNLATLSVEDKAVDLIGYYS